MNIKIFIGLVTLILASCSCRKQLRTDLSATITYVGTNQEIVLDCSNMYGAFGNRATKKGEIVKIDSVRDDGRIVVGWGPNYN
jgi:hypothetical protein